MEEYKWKVCPIQGRQLRDVRKKDILGDFRLCNTYRSGGGYEQFPKIFLDVSNTQYTENNLKNQFIVQLYGCILNCPYCYVTKDGIYGNYTEYSTKELIKWFKKSNCHVFHLMGGSPALYIEKWQKIIPLLDKDIFHSDLLLLEKEYELDWFIPLKKDNVLLAINIKGVTSTDFKRNTNKNFINKLFWNNFDIIVKSKVNFYITFTNPDMKYLNNFKYYLINRYGNKVLKNSYIIDLVNYKATDV